MADLTITAANVKLKNTGPYSAGVAGESIAQGEPVYIASSLAYRTDNNDGASKAVAVGIALMPAATGQTFLYAKNGAEIDVGATLTTAETYIVSANVGKIAPIADLATTNYLTILGVAKSSSTLLVNIVASGVQKA
jgi:hypothetical protein